jgi:hypothetical protein
MPRRIKRGDAQAVLNAFGTGGRVILRKRGETARHHQRTSSVAMARSGPSGARHGTVGTSAPKTGT